VGLFGDLEGEVDGGELFRGHVHEVVGGHGVGVTDVVVGEDHFVVGLEDGHSVLFVREGSVFASVLNLP